jgi:RNA polymerase sigma factor (TIGR02999 family)
MGRGWKRLSKYSLPVESSCSGTATGIVSGMAAALDLTSLLHQWRGGDRSALDQLLARLYEELGRMARAHLAGERTDHTLDSGALVHEAYLKLVEIERIDWRDRAHFLAVASRVMRRVLIDYAHRHKAQKRGGGRHKVPLDNVLLMNDAQVDTLLELDDVLRRLEAAHPRQARVVELYYLGGLTQQEVATAEAISQPTVLRDLQFGRAWLARAWKGDVSGLRRETD